MQHLSISGGISSFRLPWDIVVRQHNIRSPKDEGMRTLCTSLHENDGWRMMTKHAVTVEILGDRREVVRELRSLHTSAEVHGYLLKQTYQTLDGDHRQSLCRVRYSTT